VGKVTYNETFQAEVFALTPKRLEWNASASPRPIPEPPPVIRIVFPIAFINRDGSLITTVRGVGYRMEAEISQGGPHRPGFA
jgi:hypothetical protein